MKLTLVRSAQVLVSLSLACGGATTRPAAIPVDPMPSEVRGGSVDVRSAANVVSVAASLAGVIAKVDVQEHQRVTKGDLLVELDDSDFAVRAIQAQADLAAALAVAAAADAHVPVGAVTAESAAPSDDAHVALQRAEAVAKMAELDLGRAQTLRRANAVTQDVLDSAQAASDAARAAVLQAKARVVMAASGKGRPSPVAPVASASPQADIARARVDVAKAQLELAKLQRLKTKVYAPTDGIASKVVVHPGQRVDVGQPLVEIAPR